MVTLFAALLLQASSAPATTTTAVPPAESTATVDPTRRVCRTYTETGSLVRRSKVCRTAADWQRMEEDQRQQGREMVSHMNSSRAD